VAGAIARRSGEITAFRTANDTYLFRTCYVCREKRRNVTISRGEIVDKTSVKTLDRRFGDEIGKQGS